MSTTLDLVAAVKKELKTAQMTYADLAEAMGMAESSVKRMLAKGDMSLSRVDEICRALKLYFAELARRVADAQPLLKEMTAEQERAVVADKKLLLVAICVLSQWTLEQMTAQYRLSEAECVKYLVQLDRIGIIELRPLNRYRLKLAKTFRWRPHGPVMNYFREHALLDYFAGGFDGSGEGLMLVHGSVSRTLAPLFMERLQRVAQDFAQQHQTDQKLAEKDREGYTLVLAMRSWEVEAFSALRRYPPAPLRVTPPKGGGTGGLAEPVPRCPWMGYPLLLAMRRWEFEAFATMRRCPSFFLNAFVRGAARHSPDERRRHPYIFNSW